MMGRARQMLSGFMQEFRNGFIEGQSYDDYRISSKVAETTADDYYDYHRNQAYMQYGPFKRVGNHATNLPENVKIVNKSDPKLIDALEMLKNLQPKRNTSELVNRLARHLKSLKLKSNNDQQFRFVNDDGDEVKYFPKYNQRHDDADKINNKNSTVSNSTVENNKNITKASDGVVVEARSSPKMKISQTAQPKIGYAYGPPAGLPTYNQLPPPDYSYYKDGVYHHVHDLREEKHVPSASSHHSSSNGGGGWLGFDFEDTILSALGLEPPGRSSEPSVSKCSKGYIFGIFIRYLQTALVGG
ncbi:CLUMA_CG014227, isoform A [Clunio marinus]|uniref:CLUMA_CG014227, isoform A n=1 Tax=Clunio marinus TaxID=568069 RepID=A0A1J1IM95_9DIPT|nr:CLUMA_CG014227, isoform A [Clunio marinus]